MMKFRTSGLVILILIASITFITPIQSQGSGNFIVIKAYWGTNQPIEISPGDVATLTVVLRYESTSPFSNLKADLSLPEGFKAVGGGNKITTYYIGAISTGSFVKLEFPIFITPDVDKGNYTADLELEYYILRFTASKDALKVAFEVTGKPNIEVKALNSSLCEGNQQFFIALCNEGDAVASNLKITKVQTSTATVELKNGTFLDELEPEENVTLPLRIYVPAGMKGNLLLLTIEVGCVGPRSVPYLFSKTLQLPITEELGNFRLIKVYWGTNQPIEASPGDVATLTVVLRYESGSSFSNVKADLSLPEGFKALGGSSKITTYFTGTISVGSSVKLEFPTFITSNVDRGNYTADLELEYYVSRFTVSKDVLKVAFEVTGKPNIDVKALNSSLYEGRQRIFIALCNEGDAVASNLKITKVQTSTASAELEDVTLPGKLGLKNNVTIPLSIYVPTGMKGNLLLLTIEVGCVGPRSVPYLFSKTLQLPVRPSNLMPPLELNWEPKELIIGKSSKVCLELKNIGSQVLSEIKLVVSPDAILKIFGRNTLYINRLEPGERGQIYTEIYVPPATTAPTASLTLMVTYHDEDLGIVQSNDEKLSMLLRGLIEIRLTDIAVIPSTPRVGSPFSITVTVTNVGTSTAAAAYAIPLIEGLPVKPFGPRSVYIGNIEVNLPTTFTLNLQLENTTEDVIMLPVVLSYMDNLRTLHNITFSISINVAPKTGTSPQTPQGGLEILGRPVLTIATILGVSATVMVVFIIVIKRMRRQK